MNEKNGRKRSSVESELSKLPSEPGLYAFLNSNGTCLYLGRAENIRKRIVQHVQPSWTRKPLDRFLKEIAHYDYVVLRQRPKRIKLEERLLRTYRPRYNRLCSSSSH